MKQFRIGIDAGGTKVAYGLFNQENLLLDRFQHPTPIDADGPAFSDQLIKTIREMMSRNNFTSEDLQGIGICMPSYFLFDEGYVYMTSAMVNIRDFAMRNYFAERLQAPVVLDNDANAAALAEHRFGAGRGSRHMVYVAVGTGIGSGLVLNGELFRGSYGWAGECGHMIITPDEGIECGCRNKGCFMSWASGRYVPEHIRRRAAGGEETIMNISQDLNCERLHEACLAGDRIALQVLEQMAGHIAVCVFNIYQLLNVNLFVFGGGLINFGDMLFGKVRQRFDTLNHIPLAVTFRFAELKQDFGIIGAAELVRG